MRERIAGCLLALITCFCTLSACSRNVVIPAGEPPATGLDHALPDLHELERLDIPRSTRATAEIELLQRAPMAVSSAQSAVWTAGSLALKPGLNDGLAFAIFGQRAFPLDDSIFPQRVGGSGGGPMWIGLSNFTLDRWEWREVSTAGTWNTAFTESVDYVSPTGATFIAAVRIGPLTKSLNRLSLFTSDPLYGPPTADVKLLTPNCVTKHPVRFDFSASTAGQGSVASIMFTPEIGAAPISLGNSMPPPAAFSHVYTTSGNKMAELRIVDDLGSTDTFVLEFGVGEAVRDLLVIYNSSVADSVDLAGYYMSPETGRGIDPQFKLGLALGGGARETSVTRNEYDTMIRDPLRAFLDATGIKSQIKYLLLMKGMPHQIVGAGSDAVDSELCLLYENGNYDESLRLFSDVVYPVFSNDYDNGGFYEGRGALERSFEPFTYKCVTQGNQQVTISYLVARISAYTFAEAKLMIDRALVADTSGNGWMVLDTHPGWFNSETMTDPVWPWADAGQDCLVELLTAAGYNFHLNDTITVALGPDLPTDVAQNVIGYTGFGTRHQMFGGSPYPSGKLYILNDLGLTYLPGACMVVYEPFAGAEFVWNGTGVNHNDQGQVCDFIRAGGTVAIGNCYEPFTDGLPDERRVFERYLIKGDRWIEAAYKGIRYYSWHTIVLGDPLCRVRP